jgi:hypothetical protein
VIAYLWKAIWCFHAPSSEEAERCVGERALQILNGKSSDVAAGMRRSASLRRLSYLRGLSAQLPRYAALQ